MPRGSLPPITLIAGRPATQCWLWRCWQAATPITGQGPHLCLFDCAGKPGPPLRAGAANPGGGSLDLGLRLQGRISRGVLPAHRRHERVARAQRIRGGAGPGPEPVWDVLPWRGAVERRRQFPRHGWPLRPGQLGGVGGQSGHCDGQEMPWWRAGARWTRRLIRPLRGRLISSAITCRRGDSLWGHMPTQAVTAKNGKDICGAALRDDGGSAGGRRNISPG